LYAAHCANTELVLMRSKPTTATAAATFPKKNAPQWDAV
jgi:hypothetical protein